MEEDIKILEDYIYNKKETMKEQLVKAIKHLIKAYKELEEENRTLKNVVSEIFNSEDVTENFIPVSLVEEKIEELNEYYKKEIYPSLINWSNVDITECYDVMIEILQELLEKR